MWSSRDLGPPVGNNGRPDLLQHQSGVRRVRPGTSDPGQQPPGLIENPLFEGASNNQRGGGGGGGGGGVGRLNSGSGIAATSASSHQGATVSRQVSEPASAQGRTRHLQRPIRRVATVKEYVVRGTTDFFGVNDDTEVESQRKWTERRKRLLSKRYGRLKEAYMQTAPLAGSMYSSDFPHGHLLRCSYAVPTPMPGASSMDEVDAVSKGGSRSSLTSIPSRRKDSVYKMTWDGMVFLTTAVKKRLSSQKSHPSMPGRQISYAASEDDSVFYEDAVEAGLPKAQIPQSLPELDDLFFERVSEPVPSPAGSSISRGHQEPWIKVPPVHVGHPQVPQTTPSVIARSEPQTWHRPSKDVSDMGRIDVGMRRIWNRILDRAFENSDRRQYGIGVVGKLFKRKYRRERMTSEVREQLNDIDDYRPYFTYWVTTVQILITLITLAVYGFGPWGFHRTQRSSLVLVTSLSLQQVDYFEPDNFWIGPRSADLVHLGAKFTPCMRRDRNIFDVITKDRESERHTACCVRNDQSGCVQTSRHKCSEIISTWRKWDPHKPGPRWTSDTKQYTNRSSNNHRLSGSVCGQDPRYCEEPASVFPYEWPDDITKWPVCRRTVVGQKASEAHMTCEIIGRPCCIGVYGECRITTKEYCDFVRGFFHEEAALCSQVSCLDDVCGMIPFYSSDVPDQFYRLWTSLFLHAGIIHLAISVIVQYFVMLDVEKLVGPVRIGIIYIMSGVGGNLASAIFVPYRAEVGPAGSQFGLLACLLVEVIHCWQMLRRPGAALLRLGALALVLFLVGTLPWVDNYAHLFGFIFGFLMSYALLPFVSFGTYDRTIKVILIWVCLTVVIVLFCGLLVLLYVNPIYECSFCKYLNCVPLTREFCENQDIVFTRLEF